MQIYLELFYGHIHIHSFKFKLTILQSGQHLHS